MNVKIKNLDPVYDGDALVQLLKDGAAAPLIVTGSSMLPFLKNDRDTVWLKREETYKRGQILFFRRDDGSFVLHRIRKCYPDGRMLLNGDAQIWCEPVRPEQAIAAVYAVYRNGKTIHTGSSVIRIRDILWFPTRPIRPFIFTVYRMLRSIWTVFRRCE